MSIGSECYVTLPKGQIIPTHQEDYTTQVPGGGHLLIVPITHYPTFSTIPNDIAKAVIDETERCVHPSYLLATIDHHELTTLHAHFLSPGI